MADSVFRGVFALELAGGQKPGLAALSPDEAGALAAAIGRDLVRMAPGVSGLDLVLAAAHFDPAEALRPGWSLHRRLQELHARAPGRGEGPRVLAFGADLSVAANERALWEHARALLPAGTAAGTRWLHALLDWPVAQLMTLGMALVGNFDTVIGAWKDHGGASLQLDADFLAAAGRASVRAEVAEEARDYVEEGVASQELAVQMGEMPELRDAMSLVWRVLLLWLAVLALFVLAGWVA